VMKALVLILTLIGAVITEVSPAPAPQFRVSVDTNIITLWDINNGKVLGKTFTPWLRKTKRQT